MLSSITKPGRLLFVLPLLMATGLGYAKKSPYVHRGPWPIQHGHDLQPTRKELQAEHVRDVTPKQAQRVRKLYFELESMTENGSIDCGAAFHSARARERCREMLAKRPYVKPARPVPNIEAPER
jgi:hypothetical protein